MFTTENSKVILIEDVQNSTDYSAAFTVPQKTNSERENNDSTTLRHVQILCYSDDGDL